MSDTRITVRKVVSGAGFGLVGASLGMLLAKNIVHGLNGSSAWEVPLIVIGSITLAVVSALLWASVSDRNAPGNRQDGD